MIAFICALGIVVQGVPPLTPYPPIASGGPIPTNQPPVATNSLPNTTNVTFAFYGMDTNHVYGLYRATPTLTNNWVLLRTFVGSNGYVVNEPPTNSAAFYKVSQEPGFVLWRTPIASSATVNPCPGAYVGYATYQDLTNTATASASDPLRGDTTVSYVSRHLATGCALGGVTVSTIDRYDFTVFFPSNLPTNAYPLYLVNFDEP